MKKRLILIISVIMATVLMSGGYSLWERTLTIRGSIEVLPKPTPAPNLKIPNITMVSGAVYGEDTSVIDAVYREDHSVIEISDIEQSTRQP